MQTKNITKKLLIVAVLIAGIVLSVYPQNKSLVTVELPRSIRLKNLTVFADNGLNTKKIVIDSTLTAIKQEYYGRYLILAFCYSDSLKDGGPCESFWVGSKPAHIQFRYSEKGLEVGETKNVLSTLKQGGKEYDEFVTKEKKDLDECYFKFKDSLNLPRYATLLQQKQERFALRSLDFFRKNSTSYYSLWSFKHNFARSRMLSANTLSDFYNEVFPDSLKETFEGKEIGEILRGRLNTKIDNEAPDFSLKDTKGRTVHLSKLKGRYILIDFWASWCGPCRKLIPEIEKIHSKIPEDKLLILSLSLDEDKTKFNKAVAEDHAPWTQIYGGSEIAKKFAIAPIPQILLLNPEGIVIYNMEENDDYDISRLKTMLSELFLQTNN